MPTAELPHGEQAPVCQCGCGELVERRKNGTGWRTYATSSCKTRAFRNRSEATVYANRNVLVADGEKALAALETVAASYGIPRRTLKSMVDRLAGRGEIPEIPDQVTNEYLVEQLEQLAARVVASIDDYDITMADLKAKASAVRGFVDMRQLLKGEPTEIRGYADRSKMIRQFEALAREAKRRGLTLTLPAGEYEEVK